MALRVRISARADAQIRQAAQWWAENRPAAPGAVRIDISHALALLARQPGMGARYEGARAKDVRRLLVGRIHYFIYYRVTQDSLDVLAVWHSSRGQQPRL